ncbi:transposase family protein [Microcoleus sp. Pol11C2]|uniref:transposase family protein n=1 Tax=Microcoleus sp. Pol11C2 TaxID=3055389 RepID=UPI0040406F6E
MNKLMTSILNLPGVVVEDYKQTGETLILVIKSQKTTASCPVYSLSSHHLHQIYRYLVRNLPIGNREVMLRVNRRRFKCKNCRKPFNESLAFLEKKLPRDMHKVLRNKLSIVTLITWIKTIN